MNADASFAPRVRWSRHQIEAYNRILPSLTFAMDRGWTCAWVTLTSAFEGDIKKLWRSHSKLQKWLKERSPVPVHWIGIRTNEGNGVLHLFWIFEGQVLLREVCESEAVKDRWQAVHGARQVVLKHVGGWGADAVRLARYSVAQYAAGQNGFVDCRRSRHFMGSRDPAPIFQAVKRLGRDLHWPLPWHYTSPMARLATIELMKYGQVTLKDTAYVWTGSALEPL